MLPDGLRATFFCVTHGPTQLYVNNRNGSYLDFTKKHAQTLVIVIKLLCLFLSSTNINYLYMNGSDQLWPRNMPTMAQTGTCHLISFRKKICKLKNIYTLHFVRRNIHRTYACNDKSRILVQRSYYYS